MPLPATYWRPPVDEPSYNSIQFAFKQTLFGVVLMVRRAVPAESTGMWDWGRWRKADFADLALYLKERKT